MTEQAGHTHAHTNCFCCQATEALGRVFSAFGPSSEATDHFRQSRVEFLKGIRKVLDDRIEQASRGSQPRGSRIVVE